MPTNLRYDYSKRSVYPSIWVPSFQLTTYLPLQALRVERRRPLLSIDRVDKDKQPIPLGAARLT
jgi:hypothetical protein